MNIEYDVVFINPGNAAGIYQDLANDYAAIEPPTWSLLLAQSTRSVGYKVSIFDINAERLSTEESVNKLNKMKARLFCFVIYGQNPNSGTVNMGGVKKIVDALKNQNNETPIALVGSHISALPYEVLSNEKSVDIILANEGVYALRNLLKIDIKNKKELIGIKGIGFMFRRKMRKVRPKEPSRTS